MDRCPALEVLRQRGDSAILEMGPSRVNVKARMPHGASSSFL
jgi:hypothetical protein